MSYEIIKLYAVHQGDDERRHCGLPAWWFATKEDADAVAKGRGWYGGNAPVAGHFAIRVSDDKTEEVYILRSADPVEVGFDPKMEEEARKSGLAKLTELERRVLGL